MSIYKYIGTRTYDTTAIANWINEKKIGTFLENATIAHSSTADYDHKLTISLNGVTILINTREFGSSEYDIVKYTGNKTFSIKSSPVSSWAYAGAYFKNAMICNNGLIIEFNSDYSSSGRVSKFIAITADNNGNLCLLYPTQAINTQSAINGFNTVVKDSNDSNTVALSPRLNGSVTSIGSVVPNSVSNALIPYTYVSLTTQISTYGLNAVTFGDDVFITDGYFYILD